MALGLVFQHLGDSIAEVPGMIFQAFSDKNATRTNVPRVKQPVGEINQQLVTLL